MAELVGGGQKEPGKLSYFLPPAPAAPSIWRGELFQQKGIQLIHVPYRGAAPALADLLGRPVSMAS